VGVTLPLHLLNVILFSYLEDISVWMWSHNRWGVFDQWPQRLRAAGEFPHLSEVPVDPR